MCTDRMWIWLKLLVGPSVICSLVSCYTPHPALSCVFYFCTTQQRYSIVKGCMTGSIFNEPDKLRDGEKESAGLMILFIFSSVLS